MTSPKLGLKNFSYDADDEFVDDFAFETFMGKFSPSKASIDSGLTKSLASTSSWSNYGQRYIPTPPPDFTNHWHQPLSGSSQSEAFSSPSTSHSRGSSPKLSPDDNEEPERRRTESDSSDRALASEDLFEGDLNLSDPESLRTTPPKDTSVLTDDEEEVEDLLSLNLKYSSNEESEIDYSAEKPHKSPPSCFLKHKVTEFSASTVSKEPSPVLSSPYAQVFADGDESSRNKTLVNYSGLISSKLRDCLILKNFSTEESEISNKNLDNNTLPKPAFNFLPLKPLKLQSLSDTCKFLFNKPLTPTIKADEKIKENCSDIAQASLKLGKQFDQKQVDIIIQCDVSLEAPNLNLTEDYCISNKLLEQCNSVININKVNEIQKSKIPQVTKRVIRVLTDHPRVSCY